MNPNRASTFLLFLLTALILAAGPARAAGPTIVVDVYSERVLEHEDAFQRWYPASLTKMMTSYVVFRAVQQGRVSMDSLVTVSANAAKAPPSKMYYKPGSQLTLDNALKIILVKSANDVAEAIAESVGGSEQAFVDMMNAEARRLGMNDTRFINPHGLPGAGQSTTARDMAVLGMAIHKQFPQFAPYFSLEAISTGKRTYENYNILIGRFSGANGMKTGFICSSGFNQVSSATRNGRTVVSVVLGAKDQEERASESARLLQKGLTASEFGAPKLASLEPYGANRLQTADIRNQICSAAARKTRNGVTDEQGNLSVSSAYIEPMKRPARAVPVGLVGTVNPALVGRRVPVPTPRPAQISGGAVAITAGASATAGASVAPVRSGTPAPGMPVPRPKPPTR
jgi:D-alanyl-D-alanine carboxypeptidase